MKRTSENILAAIEDMIRCASTGMPYGHEVAEVFTDCEDVRVRRQGNTIRVGLNGLEFNLQFSGSSETEKS